MLYTNKADLIDQDTLLIEYRSYEDELLKRPAEIADMGLIHSDEAMDEYDTLYITFKPGFRAAAITLSFSGQPGGPETFAFNVRLSLYGCFEGAGKIGFFYFEDLGVQKQTGGPETSTFNIRLLL